MRNIRPVVLLNYRGESLSHCCEMKTKFIVNSRPRNPVSGSGIGLWYFAGTIFVSVRCCSFDGSSSETT